MTFGLTPDDMEQICSALRQTPEVEQVILFGSRAKGNCQTGSDIDLAVRGEQVSDQTIAKLKTILEEELPLPYFFDIVRYETIRNPELIEHIQRVGKELYRKS